jgi:hypothetical protein
MELLLLNGFSQPLFWQAKFCVRSLLLANNSDLLSNEIIKHKNVYWKNSQMTAIV